MNAVCLGVVGGAYLAQSDSVGARRLATVVVEEEEEEVVVVVVVVGSRMVRPRCVICITQSLDLPEGRGERSEG